MNQNKHNLSINGLVSVKNEKWKAVWKCQYSYIPVSLTALLLDEVDGLETISEDEGFSSCSSCTRS